MKYCVGCEKEKHIDEFWKNRNTKDGLQSWCKLCSKSRQQKFQQEINEKHKIWYHNNKKKESLRKRNSHKNNPAKRMLYSACERAKRKGLEFNLMLEDIIVPEKCPVLGIPLFINENKISQPDNSPSLDRIDNSKGYVKGNILVVSYRANRIKGDATIEEHQRIIDFYKGKL